MKLIVMFERWQNKATSFNVSKVKHKGDTRTCVSSAKWASSQNKKKRAPGRMTMSVSLARPAGLNRGWDFLKKGCILYIHSCHAHFRKLPDKRGLKPTAAVRGCVCTTGQTVLPPEKTHPPRPAYCHSNTTNLPLTPTTTTFTTSS